MIFNLKRKWFDLISRGEKTVEYREIKPYWETRLGKLTAGDELVFRLGYTAGRDIHATFERLDEGPCPYSGWNGKYYRIWFKPKLEVAK